MKYNRNPQGQAQWCPFFCPMAMCGTCFVIGRLYSLLEKEEPLCCDMGPIGCATCILSNACLGPPGFMLLGCCIRQRVIHTYNVRQSDSEFIYALCFPCSYFQMLMSVREWEHEKKQNELTNTNNVASPIVSPYVPPKY